MSEKLKYKLTGKCFYYYDEIKYLKGYLIYLVILILNI